MVVARGNARRSRPPASWHRVTALAAALSMASLVIVPAAALGVPGDFTEAPTSPEPVGDGPTSIVVGNFDGAANANLAGDANADLAVANGYSDDITILLGDGSGNFTPAPISPEPVGDGPSSIVTANLNGDPYADLAVANSGSDDVTILLGDGSGDFTPAPTSPEPAGGGPSSIAPGDFNGDANLDLAVANGYSDNVTILLGDGTGDFTPAPSSPEAAGVHPTSVSAGYLGSSCCLAFPSLAVANGGSDDVTILLGDGTGDFTPAPTSPEAVGDRPSSIALTCLGGIGNCTAGERDLVVANGGDDSVSILTKPPGFSDFLANPPLPVGAGPTSFALSCHYCPVGYSFAVANGGSNNVSILSEGGTPVPTSPEAVGSDPTSIVSSTLNGDATWEDLAVANRGSDNVSILLNNVPPPIPPPQARLRDAVKLKRCIKKAKKRHKYHPGRKKKAIKRCERKFG
jgi:FG-GAP-like repeat